MADEKKRIIALTETTEIGTDDYIAMDSEGGGTKKIKASHFTGRSDNVMWGGIQGDIADQTDLAGVLDGFREDVDNKANIDGYYEDLTAGSSEQLLSNTYIPDNTPYLFRTSGGSLEIGDRVYEDAIVGGSVAWNQLVQNGNFENTSGWDYPSGTFSVSNNIGTFIPTEQGQQITRTIGYKLHHKYLCSIDIKLTTATESVFLRVIGSNKNHTMATTDWQNVAAIVNSGANSANSFGVRDDRASGWDAIQMRNAQIFDLTLAFGSAMADYIYSLEQATAGSGIAWLKSQGFFIKDYYAYNAGSIKSVQTSAKKVVGFNQFDEVMELGSINSSGQPVSSNNNIRAKNYIRVTPSTSYYFNSVSGSNGSKYGFLYFYDGEKNFISSWNNEAHIYKNVFTTPSNCQYIRFVMSSNYGTAYNNDICINLHWDGERDEEYEPYVEHTYPLDSDLELRGIPKLDSGNKLYYDGDTYASDGSVTRRFAAVNLGEKNWTYHSSGNMYSDNVTPDRVLDSSRVIAICGRYIQTVANITGVAGLTVDKTFGVQSSGGVPGRLIIRDTAYTDAATFKTAMSGVYLVYELATPTTESADPYINPQIVSNWGTEQFVDERDVPVPVGHDSRYLPDLKAKLESAPNNPSIDGKYFLQYENGQATYVPVPSEVPQAPSEDGTYVLKATVSGGTATLAWVAEE